MYGNQLRRLRLHGLIERLPGTHRDRVTEAGGRTALFRTRCYSRLRRPGLAQLGEESEDRPPDLRRCFDAVDEALERWCGGANEQKYPRKT